MCADHAEKMHQLPDEYLSDALPVAKKIAVAIGAENYNVLQVSSISDDMHRLELSLRGRTMGALLIRYSILISIFGFLIGLEFAGS